MRQGGSSSESMGPMTPILRAVLPCLLLVTPSARAYDGYGVLMGTTLDMGAGETETSEKVLPGVTVTVVSPSLMGERTVVSDEHGFYRLAQLPPGIYTVRYEREGYSHLIVRDVAVRLNRTLRLNMGLLLSEAARCGRYGAYYLSAPAGM